MTQVLPPGFRFGVATSGFQIEGGYNGPGEPANNWSWWELEGRVEPSGIALDFWNQYERHLDRALAAGCDAFRLSVEWARCEPRDGEIDGDALDRYCRILDACHERNLQPLVTLHHFCHPAWLGVDFWPRTDAPDRFRQWVDLAVEHFAGRARHWVTLNEINVYAILSYLTGMFPPGRRLDVASAVRTLDHMLTGHVLAYEAIKARQPQSVVSTNSYPLSVYELDRLLLDVLQSRAFGINRHDLRPWLLARRDEYHVAAAPQPGVIERLVRKRANSAVYLEQALPRTVAAVYDCPYERPLDVIQVDYYDPIVRHHLRLPGHRTAGGRSWALGRMLWDDPPDAAGLTTYCRLNHSPGLDVWVVENGMCNRVRQGHSHPRLDGWTRPRYLREHVAAVVAAAEAGVPMGAYYHWTLADNYEWGSYEPRFGLHGIDRERGCRWLDTDSMGDDAAGAYRRLADGLRDGDRSVLKGVATA